MTSEKMYGYKWESTFDCLLMGTNKTWNVLIEVLIGAIYDEDLRSRFLFNIKFAIFLLSNQPIFLPISVELGH